MDDDMTQRLYLVAAALAALACSCLLGRCTAPTCPDCPACAPCPDCDIERALEDPEYPLAPLVEQRW